MPFDEGRLWKGEHGAELKRQLQATFQNITRVMDCVGCEKCKLWGKLQTLGRQQQQQPLYCCTQESTTSVVDKQPTTRKGTQHRQALVSVTTWLLHVKSGNLLLSLHTRHCTLSAVTE
jgi:hypothetical protein